MDVVDRIGNGGIGTDQRAFHAASAGIRVEQGRGAAEQPFVFRARAAGRHEQPCAGQNGRFADAALFERRGNDVIEVITVEHAAGRAALWLAKRSRKRDVAQGDRRRLGVDCEESGLLVVDTLCCCHAFADDLHVAFDDGFALGAELLGDLVAYFGAHGFRRGMAGDFLNVAGNGADEGDAHHACGQFGRWGIASGDGEGVDDEEVDLLFTDCLARLRR